MYDDHDANLLTPISLEEVEVVILDMHARKAPSPDGFTSNFFHHY
jgi:hypothetical protein